MIKINFIKGQSFLLAFLISLSPQFIYAATEDFCSQLAFNFAYNDRNPKQQLFNEVLKPKQIDGSKIIQFLSQHPLLIEFELQKLYAESAGVSEGFSLNSHTLMVFTVLREQMHFYEINKIKSELDLEKLFLFMIAVHDLGKSLSVAEWAKNNEDRAPELPKELRQASSRQHIFTVPIVLKIMKKLKFSIQEQNVVLALIDNDFVGQVATHSPDPNRPRGLSPTDGFAKLAEKATESGLSNKDYFTLKSLFFIVDAASYPGLRYGRGHGEKARPPVFIENEVGRLFPTSNYYFELFSLFDE